MFGLLDVIDERQYQASGIALDRDGELIGFALFRRFGDGYVIGPVTRRPPYFCIRVP